MRRRFFILTVVLAAVLLAVAVFVGTRRSAAPDRARVVLCLGDSMTEGDFGGYPAQLRRLAKEAGFRARIVSAARPGNNSREYLVFLRNSDLLRKHTPDIVLLMLGTNDARVDGDRIPADEFERNMNLIIDRIEGAEGGQRHRVQTLFLATIPPILAIDLPNFSDESRRRIVKEINPAIRRLARKRNLNLVSVERLFLENRDLLPGIHPNAAGYRRMAETFFAAIHPRL